MKDTAYSHKVCSALLVGVLVALALAPSPALAEPRPADPGLAFSIKATFKRERRGDGSPTVHYRYILHNRTKRPLYLNTYWRPFRLTRLEPKAAFRVQQVPRRPHRMRPPRRTDVVKIPAHARKVIKDWQWSASFSLDDKDPRYVNIYRLKRPARVTMTICFHSGGDVKLRPYLPKGQGFWTGTLCAKPVQLQLSQLPSDREL